MADTEALAIQPNVYYTVDEAAQRLRISRAAMLRLLQSGRTQGIRIGRQWRILGAALLDMSAGTHESDAELVADWLTASARSVTEVWDNPEDAAYDVSRRGRGVVADR